MRIMLTGAVAAIALMAGAAQADPGGKNPSDGRNHTSRNTAAPAKDTAKGGAKAGERQAGQRERAAPAMTAPVGRNADKPGKALVSRDTAPGQTKARGSEYRRFDGRRVVVPTDDRVRVVTGRSTWRWADLDRNRRMFDGCPPGLAKKHNGCLPPGLAHASTRWNEPGWFGGGWNGSYRYVDGYMLRLGAGNRVMGFIPLLGGALAVGQVWPGAYSPVQLPTHYSGYYRLGAPDTWRYYGNTIYRVDPQTSAITAIAALLTGQDVTIGQPMPQGYDVYNVPDGWRDQYRDGPDAQYRYSDGSIYQLDPTTRLVQAVIELLV